MYYVPYFIREFWKIQDKNIWNDHREIKRNIKVK